MRAAKQNPAAKPTWSRVRAAFEYCVDLSPQARKQYLEELQGSDPPLYAEVRSLLDAGDAASHFDDGPGRLLSAAAADAGPFEPRWLGKYLLLRPLGKGGMAEVHLAWVKGAAGFEKFVAIKRTLRGHSGDDYLRTLFEYEAKLGGILTHSNIIHVYDFAEVQGEYLLTMEYVEGKDLATIFWRQTERGAALSPICALYVAIEICKALDYAFNRRDSATGRPLEVIHRDISPKNILIGYDGAVKLFDFGIARADKQTHVTKVGQIRGTVPYMAPEILRGEPGARSDLFSLCLVLYEALSGREMFLAESLVSAIRLVQECTLPVTRVAELPVGNELRRVLSKGLAKRPADRHASAADLQRELEACAGAAALSAARAELSDHVCKLFRVEREREEMELRAALETAKARLATTGSPRPASRPPSPQPTRVPPPPERRRTSDRASSLGRLAVAAALLVAALTPLLFVKSLRPAPAASEESGATAAAEAPAHPATPAEITLELRLTRRAKIYLGERFIVEAAARQRFQLKLPARPEYDFRFVNERLGLDVRRRIPAPASTREIIDVDLGGG